MEAIEIIEYLKQRDLTVSLADDHTIELSPAEKITHELIERLRKYKPAIIEELKRQQRRQKVLQMLAENPGTQRAIVTDTESDPDNVILTIAIRDQYTFEMLVLKTKYDGFAILEMIHQGSVH